MLLKDVIDRAGFNSVPLSDFESGKSLLVEFDDVVEISSREFAGQVYNLQTVGGWYASNGIITHNCKCTVAIDFNRDHPSLEGYDPDAYYNVYDQALQALGGDNGIHALWDALSPDEQAKYRRPGRGAYDVFKMKVVTAKMDEITGHTH